MPKSLVNLDSFRYICLPPFPFHSPLSLQFRRAYVFPLRLRSPGRAEAWDGMGWDGGALYTKYTARFCLVLLLFSGPAPCDWLAGWRFLISIRSENGRADPHSFFLSFFF